MCDHAIEHHEICVGRGIRAGEYVFCIKDIEALVLHRAHVEIADRNDHVLIEIKFEAEYLFVPAHRRAQCLHRETRLVEFAGFDEDQ